MTKNQLRKQYKQMRNSLSMEEKFSFNEAIFENLKKIDWSNVAYVHVYLPLEKFNEPDTSRFVKWLSESYPDSKFVVSKSDFETGSMTNYLLDQDTQFVSNEYGILEPVSGELVDEKLIDIVLVPLLVVDKVGNRVGYGKGFYDRFLMQCSKRVKTYGISFFEPIDSIADVGSWDMKLHACITPQGIHYFK
jgi:5-formyltetrahydrofolate cyclo-ligase